MEENTFHIALEVTCQNGEEEFRPDITIFINGLPLSYIEVKQPNAIREGRQVFSLKRIGPSFDLKIKSSDGLTISHS